MFTKNSKPTTESARRGRPRGQTEQGALAQRRLYKIAIRLITTRGYEATTLRAIAKKAGVSVGLLYRYFPSKRAVVLALYEELSADYAAQAAELPAGFIGERFLFALRTSLAVLGPHRGALSALAPVLLGDREEGLFASSTAFSRQRVQRVFLQVVQGASDPLPEKESAALGRLLYIAHLSIILWWLLDKSPRQQATAELVALLERFGNVAPLFDFVMQLPIASDLLTATDAIMRRGLFAEQRDH